MVIPESALLHFPSVRIWGMNIQAPDMFFHLPGPGFETWNPAPLSTVLRGQPRILIIKKKKISICICDHFCSSLFQCRGPLKLSLNFWTSSLVSAPRHHHASVSRRASLSRFITGIKMHFSLDCHSLNIFKTICLLL